MTTDIRARLATLAPAPLGADLDRLSPGVRAALPHLAEAMRGVDRLFRRQLGDHVVERADRLTADGGWDTVEGRGFRYFNSPYDSLAAHAPFMADAPPLAPGRALYPAGLSAEAFDRFVAAHPDQREPLLSPYTAIEGDGDALRAVPYADRFAEDLAPVAASLRAAAEHIDHPGLKRFVSRRAAALVGEIDLLESNAEWVRLRETPLELVVGPFEVYEDNLRGLKAFYEGFLLATDPEAGARLQALEDALPELATAVPTPAGSRGAVGGMAPLIIADQLLGGGEARAGVLASAFNLPNDAGVRGAVGWKQIMIRNVMQAKFDACTRPIAQRVLTPADFAATSFDAYFFHVVLHEISHGLGPAFRADGTRVSERCGTHYSALEEAKADTAALVLLLRFAGRFGLPALAPHAIGTSYFAGFYRSARFGLHRAHGRANVIQYTFLAEKGALSERGGKLGVDGARLPGAASALLDAITHMQAAGSEAEMADFIARYGTPPKALVETVESLVDLPIDILPTFPLDAA